MGEKENHDRSHYVMSPLIEWDRLNKGFDDLASLMVEDREPMVGMRAQGVGKSQSFIERRKFRQLGAVALNQQEPSVVLEVQLQRVGERFHTS